MHLCLMLHAILDISEEMKDPRGSDWFHTCICSWVSDVEHMGKEDMWPQIVPRVTVN